jgi:3-methyladenine DNA glycosylase AlkD
LVAASRAALLKELREAADPGKKAWWERYVKQGAPFLGVPMARVRAIVQAWHQARLAEALDLEQQVDLALALFEGEYTEEKLAGMLYLQEVLIPAGAVTCRRGVDRFARLFTDGLIYDWNACDWFCVKVLAPLIEREGMACAVRVSEWRTAENLWQARASLVAFVNVTDDRAYYPLIEGGCRVLIRREERFAKTAVGWVLSEVGKHDPAVVRRVVTENIEHFSAESLNRAIKRFDEEAREALRRLRGA